MRLKNKTAIITGGANGIGRVTAMTFAREGASVVVADINENAGTNVVAEITANGGVASFISANVTQPEEVQHLVDLTVQKYHRLDILINNAGILADAQLVKMSVEQWQRVIDVNLRGVFLCGQAAARVMETQTPGGVILNAASVVALYGNFGQSNYVAAKAGVIGMTKTWARELGRKNIRVNAVAPGFIATEMITGIPEKIINRVKEKTLLGRTGEPQDIANAYLFLASEEAAFITGVVLSVDGGLML